jgi:CubicO group peptidase (beta-lactamase class C family)
MEPKELLSLFQGPAQQLVDKFAIHGLSLAISKEKKIGYLDVGSRAGDAPDDHSPILVSSMTKPVVALAICTLIAKGKLAFDTPVKEIVVELEAVRLRHRGGDVLRVSDLLDHTTEFFRSDRLWEGFDGEVYLANRAEILEPLACLPPTPDYKVAADFHHQRNYSNLCYAVLAIIIEELSGVSWKAYLREIIFEPLNMKSTTVEIQDWQTTGKDIAAHSSRINGDEHEALLGADEDFKSVHERFLDRVRGPEPAATTHVIHISKSCFGETYVGAAAGMRTTPTDLIKLYQVFMDIINGKANGDVPDVEAGYRVMWQYIQKRSQVHTCAYACGFNPVQLPWDGIQRAPGTDGEIYGRMETIAKSNVPGWGISDLWPLFGHGPKQLAVYHGGNMVGATSALAIVPGLDMVVVAMCPARSFIVDAPNLMTFTAASLAYSGAAQDEVELQLQRAMNTAEHSAALYLAQAARYRRWFTKELEDSYASATEHAGCVGTYTMKKHVLAFIRASPEGGHLEFRQHNEEKWHPLRKRRNAGNNSDRLVLSYMPSLEELHAVGLGGKNWIDPSKYDLVFLRDSKSKGEYNQVEWHFEKCPDTFEFIKYTTVAE